MADRTRPERKFSEEEVALIIKRATELQQTEQVEQEPSTALTLNQVEQIAKEAGIDPLLVRRAAQGIDRPSEVNRPSPWVGAPTRLVFERVIEGEIPVEEFENLVNEIRRTIGDNGITSVLGRTLAWTSTTTGGRRHARGRQIDVSVISRGGVTTIRVEEELRNVAGALFGGLVGGGGGGTSGISIGIGMGVFHSAPMAGLIWVLIAGGFYTLARTIFGHISAKREKELRELVGRLENQVAEIAK
ncbi:MAG TPA: hypothetical protein VIF83_04275 [Gemmatimonadaceae bacterium]